MLRCDARLVSLVECVGLVVGRVAVVLWSRCSELPTVSLANQAQVHCGYWPGPTCVIPPPGSVVEVPERQLFRTLRVCWCCRTRGRT